MILATNNRMTDNPMHANAGVLGTYVSDIPRYNANIFRRTPMSSPADPSLSSVVDPSVIDDRWGINPRHQDNVTVAPALHSQSIDLASVPEHMLKKPAPAAATPALITGNARGSMKPPAALSLPNQRIPMGEALMRIGGAGVAASGQGGLAAIGAATNAYGQVQDANRQAEMEAFAIEEARRKSIADRMASSAAAKEQDTKDAVDGASEISRLEGLMQALKSENLTGPWAGWIGHAIDRSGFGDPKKAAKRLILADLQVNAQLAYSAQTKGAITDREMALFAKPVPTLKDDEELWIAWLKPQLEVLKQLQANGITDEAAALRGGVSTGGPSQQAAPLVFDDATGKWSDEE